MFLSVFEIFKPGIGPSSSHTMGPMVAATRFLDLLRRQAFTPAGLSARLCGSLAFTGKGHATDRAVILGLSGMTLESYEAEEADARMARIAAQGRVAPEGLPELRFDPETDLRFDYDTALPGHANALEIFAHDAEGDVILRQIYYSVGGGFVLTDAELEAGADTDDGPPVPYPFKSAAEMLAMCRETGRSIAGLKRANELSRRPARDIDDGLARLWQEMGDCIDRGLAGEGTLPGGLNVRRRAGRLHAALLSERGLNLAKPHEAMDWLGAYAMAVNEENAAGGRVVTAPTNGAAGVVPSVLRYWLDHVPGATSKRVPDFLLTAAAIGGLVKHNASISGAECGCQAEVGFRRGDGGGGALRGDGRKPRTGGERRRDRPRAPSRHDLRSRPRPRPGALHRAQRPRRDEGGGRRLARAARRRQPSRAARRRHRDHAPDRPRHEREIQGDLARRPRGQRPELLSAASTASRAAPGTSTTMPGPSKASRTGPVTAFDVPMVPAGAKAIPSIGQRSPSDRPVTGAKGNSDSQLPGGRSRAISGGAAKAALSSPTSRQDGRSRARQDSAASAWSVRPPRKPSPRTIGAAMRCRHFSKSVLSCSAISCRRSGGMRAAASASIEIHVADHRIGAAPGGEQRRRAPVRRDGEIRAGERPVEIGAPERPAADQCHRGSGRDLQHFIYRGFRHNFAVNWWFLLSGPPERRWRLDGRR